MTTRQHAYVCSFESKPLEPLGPGPAPRCNISGCAKKAIGYGLYPWGGAPLCQKHAKEEGAT